MHDFWAIVLAAGESKRMGFPKMLLPFKGSTMIENVIQNISESCVKNIIVVLGAESNKILDVIGNLPVHFCMNDNYRDGMLSSVKCGFRRIPSEYKAVLVFQGDQPLIKAGLINSLIRAYLSTDNGLAIPVHYTRRGHPLLIDRKYRDEIEKLDPGKGLRSLSEKFSDDVLEVETNENGILRDFDTYDEYLMEINKIL
jgi:molybdenum cofactor cytidylyltransferase